MAATEQLILAASRTIEAPFMILVWFTVGVVILAAAEWTRLAVLYVVKTLWVSFSVLAFLWVVITSMGTRVARETRAIRGSKNPTNTSDTKKTYNGIRGPTMPDWIRLLIMALSW